MLSHPVTSVLLAAGMGVAGCSLDLASSLDTDSSVNRCEENDECSGGRCEDGLCGSTGTLETVLIEVSPPLGAHGPANLSFLKRLDDLIPSGGNLDIDVGAPARITGRVILGVPRTAVEQCVDANGNPVEVATDKAILAKVIFRPVGRLPGLYAVDYSAEAAFDVNKTTASFELTLPPGTYDIHVAPSAQGRKGCAVAPVVYRQQTIESSAGQINLNLPRPSNLEINVSWPWEKVDAPEGWTVDVLHPATGMTLAAPFPLQKASRKEDCLTCDWEVDTTLVYTAAKVQETMSEGFIRLAPPFAEGDQDVFQEFPKLIVARETLGIFGEKGSVQHFTKLPAFSVVEGRVTDANAAPVHRAVVALTALKLEGVVDTWASYTKYAEADEEGHFTAEVFAGDYRMHVLPPAGRELAAEVRSRVDLSLSRLIDVELQETLDLKGTAITPAGDPFVGATVQAVPLPTPVNVIDQALDRSPVVPSATTGEITDGNISGFRVDPGIFNVSVRPAEGSGYPWIVIPSFDSTKELHQLQMRYPVVYRGRIMSGGVPLVGALIRAYVYTADGKQSEAETASTVLQVAETRSQEGGEYQLLLPPSLESLEDDE